MNLSVAISQVSIEISDVILDSNTIIINLINLDDKPHIIDISKWMIEKYEVKVNPYLENLGISHTANDKYNLAILSFMSDSIPSSTNFYLSLRREEIISLPSLVEIQEGKSIQLVFEIDILRLEAFRVFKELFISIEFVIVDRKYLDGFYSLIPPNQHAYILNSEIIESNQIKINKEGVATAKYLDENVNLYYNFENLVSNDTRHFFPLLLLERIKLDKKISNPFYSN